MKTMLRQVSSLEKIRGLSDAENCSEVTCVTLLGGETFSYQQVMWADEFAKFKVEVVSELKDYIEVFSVKDSVMDLPDTTYFDTDDDYITKEPGLMPDILIPMEEQNRILKQNLRTLWIEVKLPENFPAGNYKISVCYSHESDTDAISLQKDLSVEVMGLNLPKQEIKVTQWFPTDF